MVSENRPTVFLVDDDELVRASVQGMLKAAGLHALAFGSSQTFLESKLPDGPRCLILDVELPGISGLELQHELAHAGIEIPIIFLTGHGDIPMTVKAIKSGAVEFLTKPWRNQDLLDAVHRGLERDRADRQHRNKLGELRRRYETLSGRERQVMNLVIAGKMNKEIAYELGTSLVTVKIQRRQVMRKMKADSLATLVGLAAQLDMGPARGDSARP